MILLYILIASLFWIGIAFVTALAAESRNRSGPGWFFLGLAFNLLALIAVLVMEPLDQSQS